MDDQHGDTTPPLNSTRYQNSHWQFLLFNVFFVLSFFVVLRDLVVNSWASANYNYIVFIPCITAYLVYEDRRSIYSVRKHSLKLGLLLIGISGLLLYGVHASDLFSGGPDRLTFMTFFMIIFWFGGFVLCYGTTAFRAASFPLFFLLFAVPIPGAALDKAISILQAGSAEVAYLILRTTGVPLIRDGYVFHLSGLNIEVAPQCSGIRSSLALAITGVLAAYYFLRTGWARTILMLMIVPLAVLKNGIRIASLTLLALFWDKGILDSDLHHKGGIVFFIIALALAGGIVVLLRKMEGLFSPEKREE